MGHVAVQGKIMLKSIAISDRECIHLSNTRVYVAICAEEDLREQNVVYLVTGDRPCSLCIGAVGYGIVLSHTILEFTL